MIGDESNLGQAGRLYPKLATSESTHQAWSFLKSAASQSSLQSISTTAVSSINIQTLAFPDGSRDTFSLSETNRSQSSSGEPDLRDTPCKPNQIEEEASCINTDTHKPGLGAIRDIVSLPDESFGYQGQVGNLHCSQTATTNLFEVANLATDPLQNFENEFDEIDTPDNLNGNEDKIVAKWKSKYKHYLILSSAGKPIYSRHGDQNLINSYIGVIQTIISFYQGSDDSLMGFTAHETRFVISTHGPLYLVAISRLGENDQQLKAQLEALYMQILSTLTLPTLTQIFNNRPNTDLRRPLEGTETLLSSLADTFTKGSPSALLSSLECLTMQRSQRHKIDNSLLKSRTSKLLYGLIVAGSKLVSVVRPKRHSLHPSDLQLLFNMLFEADCIRIDHGENWIPVCLPGFNNRGYLYMYVSFLGTLEECKEVIESKPSTNKRSREEEIAILLISTEREGFFELKQMRDDTVVELERNGSLEVIKKAVRMGRPNISQIMPDTQLQHFLYKSRTYVQFIMPKFSSDLTDLVNRRR